MVKLSKDYILLDGMKVTVRAMTEQYTSKMKYVIFNCDDLNKFYTLELEEFKKLMISNDSNSSVSNDEYFKIFMELFKGREDVFANRWYSSKKKRYIYSPTCKWAWNEASGKKTIQVDDNGNKLYQLFTQDSLFSNIVK